MALSYDQISAITQKKFIPKMADAIFDTDPLLARAKKKFYDKYDGGTSIMCPLNYAMTTAAGSFSGSQTLSTTDNDQISAAEYTMKQYYANISITRRDELMNSGDARIINFVKSKVEIAEKTLADLLGDGLYSTGSVSTDLVGLRSIVDSGNTVGGIAQGTYSWWQSQENSSTTTLSMADLQTMHTTLCIGNEAPSVILATRANYNRYYALLQPQQRFTDSETAKGGFSSLLFNGVPFIAGSKVPASHIFMLNEKFLHLWVHKDEDFRFEPWQSPVNQAVKVAKVFWAGAFGTSNARMHGKFTAVAA
jgi:hypothetical protein